MRTPCLEYRGPARSASACAVPGHPGKRRGGPAGDSAWTVYAYGASTTASSRDLIHGRPSAAILNQGPRDSHSRCRLSMRVSSRALLFRRPPPPPRHTPTHHSPSPTPVTHGQDSGCRKTVSVDLRCGLPSPLASDRQKRDPESARSGGRSDARYTARFARKEE